jgi:hypothetical protein
MMGYSAGHANYRGDQRQIVGEVKGPTTYGGFVVAVGAEYDAATDRTRVSFAHCRTNSDGSITLPDVGASS